MSLPKPVLLDALREQASAFRAAVSEETLTADVTTCPPWHLGDLVQHLGGEYSRVRTIVARGTLSPPEEPPAVPSEGESPLLWFDAVTAELMSTLDVVDPDAPAWNWSVAPDVTLFWIRWLTFETAVHRWDAQTSVGLPAPIEANLAADGVSELFESYLPSLWQDRAVALPGVVRLLASDTTQRWVVRVRENGVSLLDVGGWFDPVPQLTASATGTASDLMLMLWGRIPVNVLDVQGDTRVLQPLRSRWGCSGDHAPKPTQL